MLGAAIVAGAAIFRPSEAANAFIVALVAWGVRMLSAPRGAVDAAHAAGRDQATAEIASLAGTAP